MSLSENLPAHVGVIMDGNGRWAQLRGYPRVEGHRVGAERAKELIEYCAEIGIKCLPWPRYNRSIRRNPVIYYVRRAA